ncbi:MAG: glycerophosphodiester phosphodiesterase family protein, partial [Methylococcales bacterium]|nr:glycerophosphodiester phosphodiesterase family protein [Methylococcales bacterium]
SNAEVIQSLDAGSWFAKRFSGEKIPSLLTIIDWLLVMDVQANLEIKPYPGTTEQTTVAVLTHLNRYWPVDKKLPLVSSFERDALTLCRSLSPEIPLGFLMHDWQEDWLQQAKKLDCYSVHLSFHIATRARILAMKAEGFLVFVYTVNREQQARTLFSWGVDAVFSDYPDLLGTANA